MKCIVECVRSKPVNLSSTNFSSFLTSATGNCIQRILYESEMVVTLNKI